MTLFSFSVFYTGTFLYEDTFLVMIVIKKGREREGGEGEKGTERISENTNEEKKAIEKFSRRTRSRKGEKIEPLIL